MQPHLPVRKAVEHVLIEFESMSAMADAHDRISMQDIAINAAPCDPSLYHGAGERQTLR